MEIRRAAAVRSFSGARTIEDFVRSQTEYNSADSVLRVVLNSPTQV